MQTQTEQTQTTAEQIAEMLGNDGTSFATPSGPGWDDPDGERFDDLCRRLGGRKEQEADDLYRYVFADGSALVATGEAWDFGFTDCFCFAGAMNGEHRERCENRS